MSRKLTDEKILETLMRTGSVRDTASELGCTTVTVYSRIKQPDFAVLYAAAKDDAIKSASAALTKNLTAAVETITKIMTDEQTAAQTRVNAAQYLLQNALRFYEFSDVVERLEALESAQPEGASQ